jgi:uncharacterized protein (DUF885 family)
MTQQLKSLIDEDWKWRLKEFPEFGTFIGNHDMDAELDQRDPTAYARRKEELHARFQQLEQINAKELSEADRLNLEILKNQCKVFVDGLKFGTWKMAVNRMEGPQTDIINLLQRQPVDTDADWEKLYARLKKISSQNDQIMSCMKLGIETGMTPPRISMEGVVEQIRSLADGEPDKLGMIPSSDNDEKLQKAYSLIKSDVQPSFSKLADFLEKDYLPKLRPVEDIACQSLPNGRELYEACIKFHTDDPDATPTSVHDLGIDECNRILQDMQKCIESVGFKGTPKEFVQHLYKDPTNFCKTPQDLIAHYHKLCDDIAPRLPAFFGEIPLVPFRIIETPENAAAQAPAAYYYAPSADGKRPGNFYVNTHKLDSRPLFETTSLALHESSPGHHLQAVFSLSLDQLPPFRTTMEDRLYSQSPGRYPLGGSFAEGWALYCESLGKEMGVYKDPLDYFGYLNMNALRACRLVVDTGMHALGWTRQQAIDWCLEYAPGLSLHNIEAEIDRYITWPGQALAYKTGEVNIMKLRQEAEAKLGDKFSLQEFHRVVLSQGHVGVDMIAKLVREWIAKK